MKTVSGAIPIIRTRSGSIAMFQCVFGDLGVAGALAPGRVAEAVKPGVGLVFLKVTAKDLRLKNRIAAKTLVR